MLGPKYILTTGSVLIAKFDIIWASTTIVPAEGRGRAGASPGSGFDGNVQGASVCACLRTT